jgi:ribonuclease D
VRLAGPGDVRTLIQSLQSARRVGVDTEFHAERRFLPELFLVQLRIDAGEAEPSTWIVDPRQPQVLSQIGEALRAVPWVVHAGEQDLRVLHDALGGLPSTVLDTQIAAGLVGSHWPAPYAALVQHWLGQTLDKAETLSDWSRRPLTPAQLAYAALDVDLLLLLWDRLEAELKSRGRLELALAACQEARDAADRPPDDSDSFREIAAAAALSPTVLLVLQELAAWRLERARATNQPARAVLSDGALVDLARRQPLTTDSLLSNRRLPRSLAKDAPGLVERIVRASQRPAWAVPRIVRKRTPEWRVTAWLQLLVEAVAEREGFGAGLVVSRALAERLVLEGTSSREELAARLGWRDPLIGDVVYHGLRGELSLAIAGGEVAVGSEKDRS